MTVTTLHTPLTEPAAPLPAPAAVPDVVYVPAPAGAPADAPRVFAAINGVMRDAMPVGKDRRNEQQNYSFRGIDDVMSAMAGPLRTHGVFILPTIAEHRHERDGKMTRTLITMRYRVYGPAGDCLVADVPGEAFDFADKSTNKAQSAALKYLLFTLFMLPVDGRSIDDGDRHHPEPPAEHRAEQEQYQRRQQDRRQQRGQRQQPRRGHRDQGPAEQAPAQQQAGPRRDYLAEARTAPDPEAFAKVRAAAVAAGAPADYLGQLDQVDAEKRRAAQRAQQQTAPQGEQAPPPSAPADPEAAAAESENALRLAASRANLADLDDAFERVHGLPIAQAGAQQLDAFRTMIENGGAR